MTASKRPAKSRSGPSQTAAERQERGLRLLAGIWLPREIVEALDAECERVGHSRTRVLGEAIMARCALGLAVAGGKATPW